MSRKDELTAAEASEILGVNKARVYELANEGRIGTRHFDRIWVFSRAELEAFKRKPKLKRGPKGPWKKRPEDQLAA